MYNIARFLKGIRRYPFVNSCHHQQHYPYETRETDMLHIIEGIELWLFMQNELSNNIQVFKKTMEKPFCFEIRNVLVWGGSSLIQSQCISNAQNQLHFGNICTTIIYLKYFTSLHKLIFSSLQSILMYFLFIVIKIITFKSLAWAYLNKSL